MEPIDPTKLKLAGVKVWGVIAEGQSFGLRIEELVGDGHKVLAVSAGREIEDGSYESLDNPSKEFMMGLLTHILYFNFEPMMTLSGDALAALEAEEEDNLPRQ